MSNTIPLEKIENKILLMRGMKVMLDRDLAELYGVPTKRLNEQVKRNIKRFPADFMFQLTRMETEYLALEGYLGETLRSQFATSNAKKAKNEGKIENLRSQFVTSNRGGRRYYPYVFTE